MRPSLYLSLLLLLPSFIVSAAEITVPAGDGTLAQAIAEASNGDVLLLTEGTFLGNTVVDKGLTIRGTAGSVLMGSMRIQAAGARITLQGLQFSFNLYVDDAADVWIQGNIFDGYTLYVNNAADVRILENVFNAGASVELNSYNSSDGDGSLYIIGNRLSAGDIQNNRSEGAYIAGNTIEQGRIHSHVGAWIVGNEVHAGRSQYPIQVSGNDIHIIGNRVWGAEDRWGVTVSGTNVLVAANIVQLRADSYWYYGIYVNAQGTGRVLNNLVVGTEGNYVYRAYDLNGSDLLAANNIAGNVYNYWFEGNAEVVANNLCYGSRGSNCGRDAVMADPAFVDTVDFRLSEVSPAVDAGMDLPYLAADLDRTRTDIGPHGGPWAIDQFDRQRAPDYTGPFVYPLFEANASIESGRIQVRALGVARYR